MLSVIVLPLHYDYWLTSFSVPSQVWHSMQSKDCHFIQGED